MRKQQYVAALEKQPTDWILASAQNPNSFMRPIDILLHYVVLRRRGAI